MISSDILVLLRKDIEKGIPGNSSFKLKVTALDICGTYIVLGSNAGTLYFFNNENFRFIQKIQTKKGRITQISISKDTAVLACASSSGLVFILKIPNLVPQSNVHPVSSRKHEGSIVTALCWSNNGKDLYIGDCDGILSLLHVPLNLASSLILNLTHYLMKMDSAIYQIDVHSHYLVVSTLTKSYVCNTRLETFSVIGTKSRQGEYGGCIAKVSPNRKLTSSLETRKQIDSCENYPEDIIEKAVEVLPGYCDKNTENIVESRFKADNRNLFNGLHKFIKEDLFSPNNNDRYFQKDHYRVFCARPGFRIWESDFMGSVIATHQLKNAVPEHQSLVILYSDDYNYNNASEDDKLSGNSLSFKKVFRFYNEYLLTNSTSAFYIVDPNSSKIILWCAVYEGIQEMRAFGNTILILTLDSKVFKYLITTVDVGILILHSNGLFLQCANVCLNYDTIFANSYLLRHCWQSILNDIISNVKDVTVVKFVTGLKETISSFKSSKVSYLKNIGNKNFYVKNGFEDEENIKISGRNFQSINNSFSTRLNLDVANIQNFDNLKQPIHLCPHKIDQRLIIDSTFSEEGGNNMNDVWKNFENISSVNLCNKVSHLSDKLKSSPTLDSSAVSDDKLSLSNLNNCDLKEIKELEEIVVGIKTFLKSNPSKLVKKALLIIFLKYYIAANLALSLPGDDNRNYEPEFSLTNRKKLVAEISFLFLLCFEEKIILSCCYKDSLKFKSNLSSHSMATKMFKEIDQFYAYFISEDKGLICHKILMDNFYSVENHLGLMCCSWFSIMTKLTSKHKEDLGLQIFQNVNISRSQRTQYLRHFLDAEGWNSFMAAIYQVHHHTALYDIYYFLGYFLQSKKSNCALIDIYGCLYNYFDNLSCDIIKENYGKYWSSCSELQNDIIASFLYKYNGEEFVCSCKFPLPNCLSNESKFYGLIKEIINSLPLFDHQKIYTMFMERYFYLGIFGLVFRYDKPLQEMVPYILQSFHRESVLYLLGELDVSIYPYLMKLLVKMFSINGDTSVKCLNCSKQLPISTTTAATSNEVVPTHQNGNNYIELNTYSSLWELIYKYMIDNIGIQKSIQMLQDIDEEVPSLVALKRLLIKDVLNLLSQSMNIMAMDNFSDIRGSPKPLYSKNVFSTIEKITRQATALNRDEACQTFYFREKKSSYKKYFDSRDNDKDLHGISEPKNENLHRELSLSTGQFQSNEFLDRFDRDLTRKNYHWGVKARILNGVCYLCHLGLAIEVMVKAGGLTVFPCGHAYHTVCLVQYDKFCFICVRSNHK